MTKKGFTFAAAVIFSVIALLHFVRLIYGWEAAIGGVMIPLWLSWVAVLVSGTLAYYGYRYSRE